MDTNNIAAPILKTKPHFEILDELTGIAASGRCECRETDDRFQKNHVALFEFISDNIKDGFVEIYVCRDGDINEPLKIEQEINLPDLLDENFYFFERGLYRVRV